MTFVMILLVMTGGIVVMTAAFLGLSYALGIQLHSRKGPTASPSGGDPCTQCDADRDWYLGLSMWEQNLLSGWWWATRIMCGMKGCK